MLWLVQLISDLNSGGWQKQNSCSTKHTTDRRKHQTFLQKVTRYLPENFDPIMNHKKGKRSVNSIHPGFHQRAEQMTFQCWMVHYTNTKKQSSSKREIHHTYVHIIIIFTIITYNGRNEVEQDHNRCSELNEGAFECHHPPELRIEWQDPCYY